MKTTIQYLDAVKERHSIISDYALAKVLGVRQNTISNYRTGRSGMDTTTAAKVAELLAVNALEVIAATEIERAKREDVRKFWMRYAAAFVLGTVGLAGSPMPGQAAFNNNLIGDQTEVHICALCLKRSFVNSICLGLGSAA